MSTTRAKIKIPIHKLPKIPYYQENRYDKQFFKNQTSEYFQVSSNNINQILNDLKFSKDGSVKKISTLMTELITKPNITLHILLSNNIYYLIIKSDLTGKSLAIKALTITNTQKISSTYDIALNSNLGICVQIIDENEINTFVGFDQRQKSIVGFHKFKQYVNQFIETSDLNVEPPTYDTQKQSSFYKFNVPTGRKSKNTKPKKDPLLENKDFVQNLYKRIFPGQSLTDDEIENLTKSSKSYNFKHCYDKSIDEIKDALRKHNVKETGILFEANKMFFSFIICKQMSTIQFFHKQPKFQQLIASACDDYNDILNSYIQDIDPEQQQRVELLIKERTTKGIEISKANRKAIPSQPPRQPGGHSIDDN